MPPTWLLILVCCTRIMLYAEMLKETEENIAPLLFFDFYQLWHFSWVGGRFCPLPPPQPATPMTR